jgi:hypothetical protein
MELPGVDISQDVVMGSSTPLWILPRSPRSRHQGVRYTRTIFEYRPRRVLVASTRLEGGSGGTKSMFEEVDDGAVRMTFLAVMAWPRDVLMSAEVLDWMTCVTGALSRTVPGGG